MRIVTIAIVSMMAAAALAGCSSPERSSEDFCNKLAQVTGPTGVEAALVPGDPERIDGVVDEIAALHDRAPEEISATTRTLLTFFRSYQRAARDERRDVLAANEADLLDASAKLDAYALSECGLFLQRAVPTPLPTVDPNIEAPAE